MRLKIAEARLACGRFAVCQRQNLASYPFGRVPLVYGLGGWQGVVASRWRGQINENAKVMAFSHTFPELNHNEIMGWTRAELPKRSPLGNRLPRIRRRVRPNANLTDGPSLSPTFNALVWNIHKKSIVFGSSANTLPGGVLGGLPGVEK